MILPFAKLGALLVRTLSKPLATAVKARAKNHPNFRTTIMNFAQGYHKFNVTIQRRLYGMDVRDYVKPLNEEKAVETAAELVGELIIFGVGTAVVIAEVSRSAISDSRKEEARRRQLEDLKQQAAAQRADLVALTERVEALEQAWKPRGIFTGLLGSAGPAHQKPHPPQHPPQAPAADGGPPGVPPAPPSADPADGSGFDPRGEAGWSPAVPGGAPRSSSEDATGNSRSSGWFGFAPVSPSAPHGKPPAPSGPSSRVTASGQAPKPDMQPGAPSRDQWETGGSSGAPHQQPVQPAAG